MSHLRFYRAIFIAQIYRATKLQQATVDVAHCSFVAKTRTDQSAWSVLVYATKFSV